MSLFKFFKPKELLLLEWDGEKEDIVIVEEQDADSAIKYRDTLDANLAPYQFEPKQNYNRWLALTSYITEEDLKLYLPYKNHTITSMSSSNTSSDNNLSSSTKSQQNILHFTKFDLKRSYPENAIGSDRTKYSRDKSYLLQSLLNSRFQGDYKRLFAELQFSFICLIFVQNFEGFEQWKRLLHLISFSEEVLLDCGFELFYLEFFNLLQIQLCEVPKDFFVDIMSQENILKDCLVNTALVIMFESDEKSNLMNRLESLNQFTLISFNWDLVEKARLELDKQDNE